MKLNKILSAAGLLGILVVGGALLQGSMQGAEKYGSVDINGVLDASKLGKQSNEKLRNAWQIRNDLLTFASEHLVMTAEQAQSLGTLGTKENLTADEKTKLDGVKAAILKASQERTNLAVKTNRSEAETALLTEYNQRAQIGQSAVGQWNALFSEQMDALGQQLRDDAVKEVRATIGEVAKKNGFTMIFEASVLVYAANDVTGDVVKAVDAKHP